MYKTIWYIAAAYFLPCELTMVTIASDINHWTRHIFIKTFQTDHFLAAKFVMDYAKKCEFSCDSKISNGLGKKQLKR